jgi:hypothetical protein
MKKQLNKQRLICKFLKHYWLISFSFTCKAARQFIDVFRRNEYGDQIVENGRKFSTFAIKNSTERIIWNFDYLRRKSSHIFAEIVNRYVFEHPEKFEKIGKEFIIGAYRNVAKFEIPFNTKFTFELFVSCSDIRKLSIHEPDDNDFAQIISSKSHFWEVQLRQILNSMDKFMPLNKAKFMGLVLKDQKDMDYFQDRFGCCLKMYDNQFTASVRGYAFVESFVDYKRKCLVLRYIYSN